MYILGIETSCDETAAAVLEIKRGSFKLLSNVVSSQEKIHAQYGGIIPEVAARLHIEKMLPIVDTALKRAKVTLSAPPTKTSHFRDLSTSVEMTTRGARKNVRNNNREGVIDSIAVCAGPGLISSLMVGVETAKTLAFAFNKPLIKVNHLEGHLLSAQINQSTNQPITFPAIGLIISGGHTQLILVKDYLKYKIIGQTRDDAAGEAFDKVAKILELGYPGGPAIAKMTNNQEPNDQPKISLPRPMLDSKDFDFSFSGLKTAVLYTYKNWQKNKKTNLLRKRFGGQEKQESNNFKAALAKEFQQAVIDVLIQKTLKAAQKHKAKTIILGGGVSANDELRNQISKLAPKSISVLLPEKKMTGDNAAMIAMAGYYHAQKKNFTDPLTLRADPNWELV